MSDTVVVDANIIVSALVSSNRNILSKFTSDKNISLAAPKFVIVELFKHFERIKKSSKLPENELLKILSIIVGKVKFYDEASIALGSWVEAARLCRGTDEKDIAYLALSIELNAELWTNDKKLKIGLTKKGFNKFFEL
jgi:predicted nucleic acid-binding protein